MIQKHEASAHGTLQDIQATEGIHEIYIAQGEEHVLRLETDEPGDARLLSCCERSLTKCGL